MDIPRPRFDFDFRHHQFQVNASISLIKNLSFKVLDIVLRLPGLILLELWWRNKDVSFEDITQEMLLKAPFNSYLDMSTILDFVHRRDFDHSAAFILSNTVFILSILFLSLPLIELVRLYAHGLSICLFAFAHYMSSTYVSLEANSKETHIHLDDFVKLERHGFHFLAQLMLSVLQSIVLGLESAVARISLSMFTVPIIARMSGCPPDILIHAHNISCSSAMVFIGFYVLYCVPHMIDGLKSSLRQLRDVFVSRGLAMGFVVIWRHLKLAEQLTFAWLTMFFIRLYVEMVEKGRSWWETGPILLSGIAESTNTPLSLLALALTVGYVCKWVVDGAQLAVGGTRDHGHVLNHSGYAEALTLVLLCVQASLIGMNTERKVFLMGLVFFIVLAALLQSLFELLEPQLLSLASSPSATRGRHMRCLLLAAILPMGSLIMSYCIVTYLPLDLWCIMICCNGILVAIHATSATVQYFVGLVESRAPEPWERSDDVMFAVKCVTKVLELLLAFSVVLFSILFIYQGEWSMMNTIVILFHIIINIYKRVEKLITMFYSRSQAVRNINKLAKASSEQLKDRSDVCAICFTEMVEEARVTPCRHFFHGACLRKWLAVKQVCPLCYSEMSDLLDSPEPPGEVPQERNLEWREQHRMDGARDMWPLLRERPFESDDDEESDNGADAENGSVGTAYTMTTTDTDFSSET